MQNRNEKPDSMFGADGLSAQTPSQSDYEKSKIMYKTETGWDTLPIFKNENIVREDIDDTPDWPTDAYLSVLEQGYGTAGNMKGHVEGHMFKMDDEKYVFAIDKTRQFSFKPHLKKNPYTNETVPFNLEEFAKNPDFSDCELLDFVWECQDREGIKRIYGYEGIIIAFENEMGYTFLLKPQKKFVIRNGENIMSLAKGNINYTVGYNDIRPTDIEKVYDRPIDKINKDVQPVEWDPQSRSVNDSYTNNYVLDRNYNPILSTISVVSANDPSVTRKITITHGADVPVSFKEDENVLTVNYPDCDYCRFSKLKSYELFECMMHFPYGILRATYNPTTDRIEKSIECTGKISTGSGLYGSTYDYNGFTADLSGLKMFLNQKSDYINNSIKFDDSDELQRWIFSRANYYWTLTSTGEKAVWEDGNLVTESLKEKRKQDEIVRNEKIRKDVIASYKAKYGATTIDNIMKGKITVGMPWSLVSSAFPNGLFNSSNYSKVYKVVNNVPYINVATKKIVKQDYGMGNLVYVTVKNGKVSNVTYTNHR